MKPSVSVVTVSLSNLAGLQSTWRSLRPQTMTDWEWVVVDGGAPDGSDDWLRSIGDARVRATSEPDEGLYDAMNKGMRRSTGHLVLFLNAGDRLSSNTILDEVQASHAASHWLWAYGRVRVVDSDGSMLRLARFEPFRLPMLRMGYRIVPHQGAFFTQILLQGLREYRLDAGLAADQELMLRAARVAQPSLLKLTVADFSAGGASWGRRPDVFVRESQRIRLAAGEPLLGREWVDAIGTEVLAADKRARTWLRRQVLREPVRW